MKSNESCQRRNYVAQAELINHKTFLKYQPDSLPHPMLSFNFAYESAQAILKQRLAREGQESLCERTGQRLILYKVQKEDNKIRDSEKIIVLQKGVRL